MSSIYLSLQHKIHLKLLATVAVSGMLQNPYSSFATLIGASIVQGCYSVLLGIIVVIASEIYPTDIR